MSGYTPTTEEIEESYIYQQYDANRRYVSAKEAGEAFDRWLSEHDREVVAKAWQEGYADCMDYHMSNGLKGAEANPYKEEA